MDIIPWDQDGNCHRCSPLGLSAGIITKQNCPGMGDLNPDRNPAFPDPNVGGGPRMDPWTRILRDQGWELPPVLPARIQCRDTHKVWRGWAGTSRDGLALPGMDPNAPSCCKIPGMSLSRSIVHLWHETVLIKARNSSPGFEGNKKGGTNPTGSSFLWPRGTSLALISFPFVVPVGISL